MVPIPFDEDLTTGELTATEFAQFAKGRLEELQQRAEASGRTKLATLLANASAEAKRIVDESQLKF